MKEKTLKGYFLWFVIHIPEIIAAVALLIALTITFVNAGTRYLLQYTFVGSDEVVAIMFSWMVFPGAAAAFRRGMHYGVDMLVSAFPETMRKIVEVIMSAVVVVTMVAATYLSYVLYMNVGTKIMTATRVSYRILDMGMLVGFALMSIYAIILFCKSIKATFMPKTREGGDIV